MEFKIQKNRDTDRTKYLKYKTKFLLLRDKYGGTQSSKCIKRIYTPECSTRNCTLNEKGRKEYFKYKKKCNTARPPTITEIKKGKRQNGALLDLYEGQCSDTYNPGYGWNWLLATLRQYTKEDDKRVVSPTDIATYFNKLQIISDANYKCSISRSQFSKTCVIETDASHAHEIKEATRRKSECDALLNYITPIFIAAGSAKLQRNELLKIILKFWHDEYPTEMIIDRINNRK